MKIKFNNDKNQTIDIQGNCKITDYDSRNEKADAKTNTTIDVNGESATYQGNSVFNKNGEQQVNVKFLNDENKIKSSIFNKIASMDGNSNTLTQNDLEKAKADYNANSQNWLGATLRFDKNAGVLSVKIGDKIILRIDFETDKEKTSNQPASTNNTGEVYLIGKTGTKIDKALLNEVTLSKSELSNSELKIFDLYNTDKSWGDRRVLNTDELTKMVEEIISVCTDRNGVINPIKMRKFIEMHNLKGVNTSDLKSILDKIVTKSKAISLYNSNEKNLDNINSDEILAIISAYSNIDRGFLRNVFLSEPSLVKDICDTQDAKQIETLKNHIINVAKHFVSEKELFDFKTKINSNVSYKELANIIEEFLEKISEKEKIYQSNKNSILNMMAGKTADGDNLCDNSCKDDLNKIANQIIEFADKYNPKEMVESYLTSDNKEVRKLAQELLDSKFLDYWPTYVAAIISQETGFRETGNIFSDAGQGVMQLTLSIVKQMYKEPDSFDKNLIDNLKKQYPNAEKLYNDGIKNRKNIQLQYELGMVALRYKLKETFKFIEEGKMETTTPKDDDGQKAIIDNPTKLLEAAAMWYNSNTGLTQKEDSLYGEKTIIRADYCRNVITRFKKYTPVNIKTGSYYEWNPKIKQYVVKN